MIRIDYSTGLLFFIFYRNKIIHSSKLVYFCLMFSNVIHHASGQVSPFKIVLCCLEINGLDSFQGDITYRICSHISQLEFCLLYMFGHANVKGRDCFLVSKEILPTLSVETLLSAGLDLLV